MLVNDATFEIWIKEIMNENFHRFFIAFKLSNSIMKN